MTDAAQHALRHLIESHAASTRFALACNDRTKIIESLQSRCALLQFPKLQEADIATRVQHVCEREKVRAGGLSCRVAVVVEREDSQVRLCASRLTQVELQEGAMAALTFTADGDMRAALNNLQAAVAGMGARVSVENICRVCCACARPHCVYRIVCCCCCCCSMRCLCGVDRRCATSPRPSPSRRSWLLAVARTFVERSRSRRASCATVRAHAQQAAVWPSEL